jgi:hypothetical protein
MLKRLFWHGNCITSYHLHPYEKNHPVYPGNDPAVLCHAAGPPAILKERILEILPGNCSAAARVSIHQAGPGAFPGFAPMIVHAATPQFFLDHRLKGYPGPSCPGNLQAV